MYRIRDIVSAQSSAVKTRLMGTIDALRNERNDLSSQLLKSKLTVSAKQSSIDNLKTHADKISAQLDSAVADMDAKNKKINELIVEKLEISTKLSFAEVTINIQKASINALQTTKDTLNERYAKNSALIDEKENKIYTLSKERRDIDLQLINAKSAIRVMQAEIDMWKRLSFMKAGLLNKTNSENVRPSFGRLPSRPIFYDPTTRFAFNSCLFTRLQVNGGRNTDSSLQPAMPTKQAEDNAKSCTIKLGESRASKDDLPSAMLDTPWKSVKFDNSVQSKVDSALAGSDTVMKNENGCNDTIESTAKSDYKFKDIALNWTASSTLVDKEASAGVYITEYGGFTYRGYRIDNSEIRETSVSAST